MKYLYIAEKPSLGRTIVQNLNLPIATKQRDHIRLKDGSIVTWMFGHIFELQEPDAYLPDDIPKSDKTGKKYWRKEDLPIIPSVWQNRIKSSEFKKHLQNIQAWAKEVDEIMHCGDPDREGQAIVDIVLKAIKNTLPVKRAWLDDLTPVGLKKSFGNLKDNSEYFDYFCEQQARSKGDWLVGMNLTRAATLSNTTRGLISIGRVQTPVLKLVVDRDRAIENFVSTSHFGVRATLSGQFEFKSEWVIPENLKNPEGYLLDQGKAQAVERAIQGRPAVATKVVKKAGRKAPPLPFSLSVLQTYASAKFGLGAQAVLDIVQSLYEKHQATTYPRTDCQYMSDAQHAEVPRIMKSLSGLEEYKALIDKADLRQKSKAFDDKKTTAHTAIIPTGKIPVGLKPDETKIYNAIVQHYIAQFYPDQTFETTNVEFDIEGHVFASKGKVIKDVGWTAILGADEDDKDSASLPPLTKGESYPVVQAETLFKKTKPPAHFTEGTLLAAMVNIAKYVDDPEAAKILKGSEGLGTEATRAATFETLKKRGFMEAKGKKLLSTQAGRSVVDAAPQSISDPIMTAMWEGRLAEIGQGKQTQEAFLQDQAQFVTQEVAKLLATSLTVGSGAGGGKPRTVIGTCPKCGGEVAETPKAFGCSNWKEKGCKFAIWKIMASKKLGVGVAKELLNKGETAKEVKGFKSKAGKEFSARLKLDGEGKVSFLFENKKS